MESGTSLELKNIAKVFFGDVNYAFREQLIVQICALTDRGNKNLTLDFFLKNAEWDGFDVSQTADRIKDFRKILKPARDNLIAHCNRDTLADNVRLGIADMELWNQFWLDIQKLVAFLSKKYLNQEGVYINALAGTDLPKLVAALQQNTTT